MYLTQPALNYPRELSKKNGDAPEMFRDAGKIDHSSEVHMASVKMGVAKPPADWQKTAAGQRHPDRKGMTTNAHSLHQ
jgi:hypothetical protein